ncbi:putative outer membrane lipoprotein [Xanthomonas virus PB119]|nr:putative outer membrane lipoprotein [Xanthomonas virus PB119]
MRKLSILMVVMAMLFLTACSKVPAGNVGVKAYLLGSDKGVDTQQLGPGRYYIGWNEELYLFPTFTQNYTWAKTEEKNEELGFQTNDGMEVTADVGISYQIDPNKAALIFQKYRKGVDEITDTYLRNMVRDALVKHASKLPVESAYGEGKSALIAAVQEEVAKQVEPIGIKIEKIYWIGSLRLPAKVIASINSKVEMTQEAQRAQNEKAKAEAMAAVKVAEAQGAADALIISSQAEAESIRIKASAISANAQIVQYEAVQKWNGVLPTTNAGGAVPFIGLK